MPILYIHGMGGGGDSRIPSILREEGLDVIVRTYDFDPDVASAQITLWVDELKPELVIGESLGSLHALRIQGIPKVLVSPALNAPIDFDYLDDFDQKRWEEFDGTQEKRCEMCYNLRMNIAAKKAQNSKRQPVSKAKRAKSG